MQKQTDQKIVSISNNAKKINDQPTARTQIKIYLSLIFLFVLIMGTTYRYSLINAKNLELQSLKKQYKSAVSEVNLVNIDLESKYNLTSVEEYAKRILGMQKPDKTQIIYVDTRIDNYLENKENVNIFTGIKVFFEGIQMKINE